MTARVGDVATRVADEFPEEWAEPWDQPGLLAGFADADVTGVLVTLDPTEEALLRAAEIGTNVLVTHHPAFLHPPARLTDAGGIAVRALDAGIALIAAHTNLDRSPAGGDALPLTLGLDIIRPLEDDVQPADLVVAYVPEAAVERIRDAMAAAGAGRIGLYDACSFSSPGTGSYVPRIGARPLSGTAGARSFADEVRLEMVAPVGTGAAIAAAARDAHPYDEPVVLVQQASLSRGAARLGRLCETGGRTVRELAEDCAARLAIRPRVVGDPDAVVEQVAVANGSGGSLLGMALRAGAGALVTGELRYHDALDAAASGLAVIELGHDASEWPMVAVLAKAVRSTPGIDPGTVAEDEPGTLYWTA